MTSETLRSHETTQYPYPTKPRLNLRSRGRTRLLGVTAGHCPGPDAVQLVDAARVVRALFAAVGAALAANAHAHETLGLQLLEEFQMLLGNDDTQSRNMYLYSPQNSTKWYILF